MIDIDWGIQQIIQIQFQNPFRYVKVSFHFYFLRSESEFIDPFYNSWIGSQRTVIICYMYKVLLDWCFKEMCWYGLKCEIWKNIELLPANCHCACQFTLPTMSQQWLSLNTHDRFESTLLHWWLGVVNLTSVDPVPSRNKAATKVSELHKWATRFKIGSS